VRYEKALLCPPAFMPSLCRSIYALLNLTDPAGHILIIDDESSIRQVLKTTLTAFGFTTDEVANAEDALGLLRRKKFEVVLLDLNMAGMGGFEACTEIRRIAPGLSILVLSVRDSQDDKVQALEAGADDYITKPFHISELIARLRSAVRRARLLGNSTGGIISIGKIDLDPARRTVKKSNQIVHLTPKEFDLLHYLMANAGLPITHARLLQGVWGAEHGNELEYLRTFVRQLRIKLEDNPGKPTHLITEAYVGYRFRSPQDFVNGDGGSAD
jgi:two-component system KDP operon response regulator KdpE